MFHYHQLRDSEKEQWRRSPPEKKLTAEDQRVMERVGAILEDAQLGYAWGLSIELTDDLSATRTDELLAELCRIYRSGSPLLRSFVRSQISRRQGEILNTFSRRAAVMAVRSGDGSWLELAATAQAVENLAAGDCRDNLVTLGLLHHCASKIGRPSEFFERAAEISGPCMSLLLREFLQRSDLRGILQAMGWREVWSEEGVGYVWGC